MTAIKLKNKEFIKLNNLEVDDFQMFKELIEFDSVSGNESEVAEYVKDKLRKLNFDVNQDKMGNVYAVRHAKNNIPKNDIKNERIMAMILAHMDNCDIDRKFKNYKNYFNRFYDKSTDDISFNNTRYNSLALDNFDYTYGNNINKTNEKENIEVSKEEILDIWNKKSNELKMCFGKEFLQYGFTCNNCVNGCKKNKICGYFANDDSDETKKLFAIYKKSQDKSLDKGMNELFVQESFDLNGKVKSLKKPIKEENNKANKSNKILTSKDKKYIVNVDLIEDKITGSGQNRVLGGDDKCGIFIALKVAEQLPNLPMKILFTVEEETGCNGAKYFVKHNAEWLEDVKYCLTIDRKDTHHLLWSQKGVRSCSDDFAGELFYHGIMAGIPVSVQDGGSADVVIIRDYVPNSVNMSAGYFKAHTANEYIVPSAVDKILEWVKRIVLNV